jgi:hypothetical protein
MLVFIFIGNGFRCKEVFQVQGLLSKWELVHSFEGEGFREWWWEEVFQVQGVLPGRDVLQALEGEEVEWCWCEHEAKVVGEIDEEA